MEMTEDKVKKIIGDYLKTQAFRQRKITDNPADAYMIVNRNYLTLNGPSSTRPTGSVMGQPYYDTTIGKPIWWNGSTFKDAQNNTV